MGNKSRKPKTMDKIQKKTQRSDVMNNMNPKPIGKIPEGTELIDTKLVYLGNGLVYHLNRTRKGLWFDTIALSYPTSSGVKTISRKTLTVAGWLTQVLLELALPLVRV